MSSTKAELTTLLEEEIKGLSTNFVAADYSNALDDAERETGWAFPVANGFRTLWQKERSKRHLYWYLASESSEEFKVRQLNLNQKFDHLFKLVDIMDKQFNAIQESRPDQFAGTDSFRSFGTQIDAGFQYDDLGRDTTYSQGNLVVFNPSEND